MRHPGNETAKVPSSEAAKVIATCRQAASRGRRLEQFGAALLMWLSAALLPAHAQEQDPASLQKEVDQLRQEVQSLKEQVKSLQEAPTAATPPQTQPAVKQPTPAPNQVEPAPAKPPAGSITALRESWSHVEKGMTKAQIQEVLGPPTNELTINSKLVWYYYYAGIGGSSVFFNADGRVSSHQRPTVGWW
jgi:SmpA / OmlA family